MKKKKEIKVRKIAQIEGYSCSAASIQMTLSLFPQPVAVTQSEIIERLVAMQRDFFTRDHNRNAITAMMPNNSAASPYFHLLFSNYKISTITTNFKDLPSPAFIIKNIKTKPLIFSGIFHPFLSGNGLHAFLNTGYYLNDSDIFWILTNDPLAVGSTGTKVAWVYREFIDFHRAKAQRYGSQETIDIVSKFDDTQTPVLEIKDNANVQDVADVKTHSYYNYSPANLFETFKSYLKKIHQEDLPGNFFNYTYNSKTDLIWDPKAYVPVDYNLINDPVALERALFHSSVVTPQTMESFFERDLQSQTLYFYPVVVDGKPKIELIFREKTNDRLVLMGIQEPLRVYQNMKITAGSLVFKPDHMKPNYKLIQVYEAGLIFMTFKIGNDRYFSPVETTRFFLREQAYTYGQFLTNIKLSI